MMKMPSLSISRTPSLLFEKSSRSPTQARNKSSTSKHLELFFIHAPETHVKGDRRDEQDARQACIQDDEMGIFGERCEGHGEQGADSGHGDGERVYDGAHAFRGLVVGVFGAGGETEHLGHAADGVDGDLQEHGNAVRDASVVRRRARERRVVARGPVVDPLLQTGCVGHGDRQEEESEGDAGGGAEGDVFASEPGVNAFLDEWIEYDARDRVDGFDGVVGHARVDHLACLGDEVVEGLVQAEPVEGEKEPTYV